MDDADLELEPEQPAEVAEALARLLREDAHQADPWWEAGIEDAVGT